MAAVMSVVACLLLVVGLFDTLQRLRTPDARSAIDDFLTRPPGDSLGVTVDQVTELARVLALVSGALAATALVFAVYVLQRHRVARIGFTVTAGLLLLTIPVAGAMPFLVAAAAGLMWSRPARDWYAGRTPAQADAARPDRDGPPTRETPAPWLPQPPSVQRPPVQPPAEVAGEPAPPTWPVGTPGAPTTPPPAAYPFGSPPPAETPVTYPPPGPPPGPSYGQAPTPAPYGAPAPYGQPGAYPPAYGTPPAPAPYGAPVVTGKADRRPATVTVAALLTWVGAGAVAAGMVAFMVLLATDGDLFIREFDKAAQGSRISLDRQQVLAVGWAFAAMVALWAVAAAVLAVMAFRRSQAGRIGLVVSASATVLASLLMILSVVAVVPLILAAATITLLFSGGANDWFARRLPRRPGPPSYPYQQGPPPQGPVPPAAGPPPGRVDPW